MLKFCFAIFCLISLSAASQDSTYYKSAYAGGYLIVPQGESWEIDRVFVNDGEAYSIKISNANFDSTYNAGDTIRTPYYIAEMELLTKRDLVQYQIYYKKQKD